MDRLRGTGLTASFTASIRSGARPGIAAGNQAPNALFWDLIFVVLLAGAWILVTR